MQELSTELSTYTQPSQWKEYIEKQATFKILKVPGKVSLDLGDQNLTDQNIVALAEVLKTDYSVWKLDLSQNTIGDMGAKALANALKTNRFIGTNGLTDTGVVDLTENCIGKEGYIELVKAISESKRPSWAFSMDVPEFDEVKDKAEIEELKPLLQKLNEERDLVRMSLYGGDCILC
jgi:Ran GTPase-activating protein (RanGAP) involved in mRNA processing and transport